MRTSDAAMTRHLVETGVFEGSEFGLVDVGASGGIDTRWSIFGDRLRAWGFDVLEGEVERLNALSPPNVGYHAYRVGYKGYQELLQRVPYAVPERPEITNDPGLRLSVWKVLPPAEAVKSYDATGSQRKTERQIDLDDFFAGATRPAVDFIKTDTDGSDYEVLLGAARLIRDSPVLGVQAECIFHGRLHPHTQVFANLDRSMREAGFSLFDMTGWRYSRAALPSRFVWGGPGPTEKGQLWWADFLYFRDLGDPRYEENWGLHPPATKILKLACSYETYDLADCAAELLLKYDRTLRPLVDVGRCLDLLARSAGVAGLSYLQHRERFEKGALTPGAD